MSRKKEMFSSIQKLLNFEVRMGNKNKLLIIGKVAIKSFSLRKMTRNKSLCPWFKIQPYQCGPLVEKGYRVKFENKECIIFYTNSSNSQIVAHKMTKSRMFPLITRNEFSATFNIDTIDLSSLWHLKYGHLNFSVLNLLYKKQTVR